MPGWSSCIGAHRRAMERRTDGTWNHAPIGAQYSPNMIESRQLDHTDGWGHVFLSGRYSLLKVCNKSYVTDAYPHGLLPEDLPVFDHFLLLFSRWPKALFAPI